MNSEIERKFLVPRVPPHVGTGEAIRQGYLTSTREIGATVRVRLVNDSHAFLTIKSGSGINRIEVELPLTIDQFETLWPLTAGRRVVKTRYEIVLPAKRRADFDVYEGHLSGLMTVEVEFDSEAEARRFVAPSWFGQEVTGDPRFQNATLASIAHKP
jgi:adenylate cyclase